MKRFPAATLGMALLTVSLSFAVRVEGASSFDNYIAAVANESVITRATVEDYVEKSINLLRRTYAKQPDVLRRKANEAYDEALQQLLERELILHDFKESGGTLPESLIDDEVRTRIRERFSGDRVSLIKTLQAQGITFETFRQRVREDLIIRYMTHKNSTTASVVSPTKIEIFYREHPDKFKLDEQIKLGTIVISRAGGLSEQTVKALGLEVISKIASGASFAEMASIYSEGSQRRQGGDWEWVDRGQLKKGLAEVAFAMPTNRVGGLIGITTDLDGGYWIYHYDQQGNLTRATKYGAQEEQISDQTVSAANPALPPPLPVEEFYLLFIENKRSGRTKTIDEVREEIERDLTAQERERVRKKWISHLKEKSFIRYF